MSAHFLARLFNLIIETGTVPDKFGLSYTIPLLKGNFGSMSKFLAASDFRGMSISIFNNQLQFLRIAFFKDINTFSSHQITNLV